MNAEAVKVSLERNLTNPQSSRVSELGPIASVEATDATTVTIKLKTPFAPLTAALADRAGMVMSPKQLQAKGDDFGQAPVCVGPFKFAKRVPQNSIDLVKDPNYYDAKKVHLDRIVYRIITDGSVRAANLKSGDAQVADTLGTDDVPSLKQDTKLSVLESPSLGYQGVTFNVGNIAGVGKPTKTLDEPFAKDPRIRQAFELAIDREALVDNVFDGLFDTACGPVAPQTEFSNDALQTCREHDPAQAKKLLQQAGRQAALQADDAGDEHPRDAAARPGAAGHGQGRRLRPEDRAGRVHLVARPAGPGQVPAAAAGLVGSGRPRRQHHQLRRHGWLARTSPDTATPRSTSCSARLDSCRRRWSAGSIYGKVQALLQKDDPLIYLYRQRNLTGVSKTISGVQVYSDGLLRVAFAGYRK